MITPLPRSRLRGALRRDVLAICAVAFLADIIAGIVMPTFSLYAEELGASLVLVGTLTTLSGLTQLVSSFPLGLLSDRIGRGRVLLLGMGCFAAALLLFAGAPSAWWLVPGRLVLGVAMVATFWIAAAYLGDVVSGPERGVAFGLLTTSMGAGFTVGPLVGGWIAAENGTRASYLFAACVGLIGIGVILTQLPIRRVNGDPAEPLPRASLRESLRVGRDRNLVAAAIGNVLSSVGFGGAISTFFPLYGADEVGLSAATIGTLFAVRAGVSAVARLPSGMLASAIGSRSVLLGALALEAVAIVGIGWTEATVALGTLLALEGVAYGAFLTSGHAFVAEHTVAETRGAALGLYSSAGSVGGTLAPLGLGLVGRELGLPAVFFVTTSVFAAGLAALVWLSLAAQAAPVGAPPATSAETGGEA